MAGKSNGLDKKPKTKKSTKGKKNWRKNIDISDLEKKNLQLEQEKLLERDVQFMKDDDLFTIDTKPMTNLKDNLLKKKTQRVEKVNKNSKNEERQIRRIAEKLQNEKVVEKETINEVVDLWGDDVLKIKKNPSQNQTIKFPKLPIPHPGQSYNPSKQDISSLLHKIVDIHKKPEEKINEVEERLFPNSEDEDEISEEEEFKVSNNPAVDDFTQRKTKKDKKKDIEKKLKRIAERDLIIRRENKIKLANEKSLKRIQKEQEIFNKEQKLKKKEELRKQKEEEELIKRGFIEE
jgi:nucleolar protein 53